MKIKYKRLIYFLIMLVLSLSASIVVGIFAPKLDHIKNTDDQILETRQNFDQNLNEYVEDSYLFEFNKNIAGIRITDIVKNSGAITKINYLADSFADAGVAMRTGEIVDLANDKNFHFANRGTIQLIVLPPDPTSKTYNSDIKSLEKFKKGDYWKLTLLLPNIFTSSVIYYGYDTVGVYGSIKDYSFIGNSNTDNTITYTHESQINHTSIPMSFYSSRVGINPNEINHSSIVTIHYELDTHATSPIMELPVIGTSASINSLTQTNTRLHMILTSITMIALSIFLFITILKKQNKYIPLISTLVGIFLYSICYLLLASKLGIPVTIITLSKMAPLFTIFAAIIAILMGFYSRKGPHPLIIITSCIFIAVTLIPILECFLPEAGIYAVELTIDTILVISGIAALVLMIYGILSFNKQIEVYVPTLFISLSTISSAFITPNEIVAHSPIFWINFLTVIVIFILFLKLYIDLEKRNTYLTENLKTEIDIHTNELLKALNERNTILQFVTHDLKKPNAYYLNTINKLSRTTNDPEALKLLDSLREKTNEVNSSLNRISEYSKLNFLNEKIEIINIKSFIEEIFKSTNPDCDAAGVYLTLDNIAGNINVFGKLEGLRITLINIIFNAIEHSGCEEIIISAEKKGAKVLIQIKDNGKGIKDDIDVFKPYVSELKGVSHGLGLYMCKQAVESMNGTISYTSSSHGTTFNIELLAYIKA